MLIEKLYLKLPLGCRRLADMILELFAVGWPVLDRRAAPVRRRRPSPRTNLRAPVAAIASRVVPVGGVVFVMVVVLPKKILAEIIG
jgi:hypothetical protein